MGQSCVRLSRASEETREGDRQTGASLGQQLRRQLEVPAVDIAPAPGLCALERSDHRVAGRVEMLTRVGVRGILAAADMPARQAHAKLVPLLSNREAAFAARRARRYLLDGTHVFAATGA